MFIHIIHYKGLKCKLNNHNFLLICSAKKVVAEYFIRVYNDHSNTVLVSSAACVWKNL